MSDKPNVIVFFTDQQRWDSSSLHGNPLDIMPNFDRIAQRGTHLAHCFTNAPVCGPARACWQTGTYISTNGTVRNGIPLTPDLPHLADCFNHAGYHTSYIGKWHLANHQRVPAEERGGYQQWLAANATEHDSDAYDCVLYDNDGEMHKLPGYRVDAQTDAMIRYIDGRTKHHADQPFFLFASFLEPHFQNHIDDCPPPDGYRERYAGRWTPPDLAALPHFGWRHGDPDNVDHRTTGGIAQQHLGGYWGMVKRLDEAFGRLLDALKSLGIADNTIVLFTTDHGCHFRTRNSEYKRSCHDSSIRIPTAFIGPGFVGGGRVEQMTNLVDLPATLLDAAGIEAPDTMQGRSIMPLLRGQRDNWPEEALIQVCDDKVGRSVRTRRWKYCVMSDQRSGQVGMDFDKVTYREAYLYDLEYDPYELTNLIDRQSHTKVREVMRERMIKRMVEIGEAEPKIELIHAKPSGQRRVTDAEAYQ